MGKLIYVVNLILAVLIISNETGSSSDKTIIITSFLYAGLILINLILGVLAKMDEKPVFRYYFRSALLLLAVVFGYLLFLYSPIGSM